MASSSCYSTEADRPELLLGQKYDLVVCCALSILPDCERVPKKKGSEITAKIGVLIKPAQRLCSKAKIQST